MKRGLVLGALVVVGAILAPPGARGGQSAIASHASMVRIRVTDHRHISRPLPCLQ
jgi:hypothetical protein